MDLLTKAVVAAVIIIVVLVALYYGTKHVFSQPLTEQQAEALIVADLQKAYPGAVVNVTNASQSVYAGSWHVVTALVLNATSQCPSYYVYSFDYPQFGFVYRVENTYTSNCVIYGLQQGKAISSYPVAITRSYDLNNSRIINYVSTQGRSLFVTAKFYNVSRANGVNYTNVWVVNYSSKSANMSVYAVLSQMNGTMLAVYNMSH